MDYLQVYYDLMERATYEKPDVEGVEFELHHIWPVCLGGTDDRSNLVSLTTEEHFLAHKLLAKIMPDQRAITYAYYKMSFGEIDAKLTNKDYAAMNKAIDRFAREKDLDKYYEYEDKSFNLQQRKMSTRAKRKQGQSIIDYIGITNQELARLVKYVKAKRLQERKRFTRISSSFKSNQIAIQRKYLKEQR
jgi:hypothetical protein